MACILHCIVNPLIVQTVQVPILADTSCPFFCSPCHLTIFLHILHISLNSHNFLCVVLGRISFQFSKSVFTPLSQCFPPKYLCLSTDNGLRKGTCTNCSTLLCLGINKEIDRKTRPDPLKTHTMQKTKRKKKEV